MKKLTAILLITTTFLTACGTDGSSDTGKETTTQGQTIEETQEKTLPEAIENVDTSIEYDSMDIFLSSDFVLNLKEKGWNIYVPEFNEEKYSLIQIISNTDSYHEYYIRETATEQILCYSVRYDTYAETLEEKIKSFSGTDNILTTAEMGGVEYDVYLVTSPYNVDPETNEVYHDYSLSYLLKPRCTGYLSVGSMRTTQEEVLGYFSEITLVEAVEE